MYKCMSIIFWDRILRHKSFLWWVSLYMIKKKTSNKVPCVWFPRQNLFCAKLVSRHFLFITCIYHFIVLFLIHFLFKCLPLLHIFYTIIYPLHVSHTFCIQSSTTIVPVTPHNFHFIVYNTLQFLMLLDGPLCWGAILVCLYVSFLWLLHQVGIHSPWVTHPVFVEW